LKKSSAAFNTSSHVQWINHWCALFWQHSAPTATKQKRPLTVNCFFDLGCVPLATICGNACLPGARARREGRSFNVALVGAALRVACGSFPAAYGVSERFPRPLARGRSHAASSGRFARSYSRPRWSRPINGLPSSFPGFCRKYDLTWVEQQDSGPFVGCGVHRMVAIRLGFNATEAAGGAIGRSQRPQANHSRFTHSTSSWISS
jgi:hypothetical protein